MGQDRDTARKPQEKLRSKLETSAKRAVFLQSLSLISEREGYWNGEWGRGERQEAEKGRRLEGRGGGM